MMWLYNTQLLVLLLCRSQQSAQHSMRYLCGSASEVKYFGALVWTETTCKSFKLSFSLLLFICCKSALPVYFSRFDSSSGGLLRRIFVGFVFFLLKSVVIPAKDFIVVKMKVFSNSEPLSADLARKALDVVGVFPGPHYKFKRGYWLVACGANTRDPKQPK